MNAHRVSSTAAALKQAVKRIPADLKLIRLELARSDKFPAGSFRHGYEFIAPLDASRHIDLDQWRAARARCSVRRFWVGEEDQVGRLVHKPGGGEHAFWAFDYDPNSTDDDEPGYRFGAHAFVPGEYVTIRGHDGEQHTFRVVSVTGAR
jgi:hypothetical protein